MSETSEVIIKVIAFLETWSAWAITAFEWNARAVRNAPGWIWPGLWAATTVLFVSAVVRNRRDRKGRVNTR